MADIVTNCLNGEIRAGDLVIASPNDDYALMVGRVLSINKTGTPEHDAETGNPGDSIHVDFMDAEYSANRIREIEQQLGELYGRPTTPGIMPPIDVDDVIMETDMLYRITGIGQEELEAILDSGGNAAAYVARLEAGLRETPAQAALHEPDIYDDAATAALRVQLIGRLDENLTVYFDTLRSAEFDLDITGMTSEIAAVTGAHYYLSEIHNFHTSELEYLLQFQNPLSVVADAFEMSGTDDRSDIMWAIFDRQDALQGGYPLVPDTSVDETQKRELFQRLDSNLSEYCESLMSADKREIIGMAEEIAAQYAARDYLKSGYEFREGEVEYLLSFKHPLAVVANQWPGTMDGLVPMDSVVQDILTDRASHGDYLKADAPHTPTAVAKATEKTSVMDTIRHAREDAKNNPAPHKDTTGKSHEPEL
ncbi:MAG: DUF3848 domain-containing protein [Christensenellaceae bacterium]|jgi:hypothetical protein|nr:DUF3848 domain-containing protein [Christensenellaceae bacterium]